MPVAAARRPPVRSARQQAVAFAAAGVAAKVLRAQDLPALQAMFDANPAYFQAVNGRLARPDEAQQEFDERPPSHLSWSQHWLLGLWREARGGRSELVGVASVTSDLVAADVWHLGLYLLATSLHGRGIATPLYEALEAWVRGQGARWLRLGVVLGNTRAERFWAARGFCELRRREGIDTGGRINTLRVMLKPLDIGGGGDDDALARSLAEYLALVPRDRPGATLP